eukprot:s121_g48.t1
MIVAFWQLPARPYKPQQRPLPERVSLAEEALVSDPMQEWFESRDVFACSRAVAEKRRYRWPNFEGVSLDLLGRTATQLVREYVRLLRPYWRRQALRSLQPNGNYQLTKLGKHFFKDKWVDWVVHVPVIIRGVRRNGRNRGMPYERTKRLPVTDLNVALSRQSEGLTDAQAARRPSASRPCRSWVYQVVDTVLDQPLGALRDVSYQLFRGDEILESAFEQRPDKLCVARQLAELMRLPLQEVLSDFDAITGIGSRWREQGITPREIRSFCIWRQAPMFYVDCQGRLLDKYEPAVKEQRAEYQCKLCAAPITAATCELDHIVPVHQSFSAQAQNLQALCLECHRNKTALEYSHATTLESRFSRQPYEAYVESPRLPPLVFKLNSHKPDHICHGIDVVRCRKNALTHARFPAPIFCPKDNMEQAREGHLADLTYVKLQEDGRWAVFPRLPYVGEGWYAKPAVAYMLEKGIATWNDFAWSLDAWTPRRTWTRSP